MTKVDMRIGNTAFMHGYWFNVGSTLEYDLAGSTEIASSWSMDYEKEGGKEELKAEIVKLHELIGNAETNGYTVVIGNGVTQLLFAALDSFKSGDVYVKKPYWFRFPEMIAMSGKTMRTDEVDISTNMFMAKATEIVTYPSNPENRIYMPIGRLENRIFDCCYHWPHYHSGGGKLAEEVMLFGLAKATGHAGSRIGWALVQDPEKAKQMARYIEMTTGGVSVDAQRRAKALLETQTSLIERSGAKDSRTCFAHGRSTLMFRWKQLKKYPNEFFVPKNGSGMFAWCSFDPALLQDGKTAAQMLEEMTGIQALDGQTCGGDRNDFRLNMGCSDLTWTKFIEAIKRLSK